MSKIHLTLLLSLLVLTGCNPYAYINIPPQTGDLALHNPNQGMVVTIETEALQGLLAERPVSQPVTFEFPEGTNDASIKAILSQLGEQAVEPVENTDEALAITLTQVRVRGTRAQVDVLYPTLTGTAQLLTVYLSYTPMSGWRPTRIVDWPGTTHSIDHGGVSLP